MICMSPEMPHSSRGPEDCSTQNGIPVILLRKCVSIEKVVGKAVGATRSLLLHTRPDLAEMHI